MCATFQLERSDAEEFCALCDAISQKYGDEALARSLGSDVYPGGTAIVSGGEGRAALMRWGFPLEKSRRVFNARAESLAGKPMFQSVLRNRCAVPVSWFYEPGYDGRRRAFAVPEAPFFWLAALWRKEPAPPDADGEPAKQFTFTVVTTRPSLQMQQFHDRMPVVLPGSALSDWLAGAPPEEVCVPFERELHVFEREKTR